MSIALTVPPPIDPNHDALFLDFDGTLVEFALRPEDVEVPAELLVALESAHQRFGGALALVSGRALSSIDSLLQPLQLPAAGIHGLELRRDCIVESNLQEAQRLQSARRVLAAHILADDPIRIEDKGGAIVLHYRGELSLHDRAQRIATLAAQSDDGLVAVSGHAIAEIRPRAITKAGAILRFMQRAPFEGRRPIFAGDDVTDEDGFEAVQSLGGFGIKVGSAQDVTKAHHGLKGVQALRSWLYCIAKE